MNPLSDEAAARFRQAFSTLAAPSPPCPHLDEIFSAVRGDLDLATTRRLIDHTSLCGGCAEAWRLAKAFAEEEQGPAIGMVPTVRRGTFTVNRRAWLAAAAVVLLATSAGVIQRFWSSPIRTPEYRQPVEGGIVALSETTELSRDACRLRWSPAPAGARYTVRVAAEDLSAIARVTDLEAPEYVVPVPALSSVPSGGRIVWQVDAALPDGRIISSPTFVATLK